MPFFVISCVFVAVALMVDVYDQKALAASVLLCMAFAAIDVHGGKRR